MIKAKYNQQTTLIEGYFPSFINYPNNVINTEAKTIDGSPYIEISDEEHQETLGKQMCVVNGVYQEYVKPLDVQLQETKASKIAQCKAYLISTDWQVIRLSDPSSGEPLKEGVSEKRALARSLQVDIAICTTLEELNNINIDFS